MKPQKRMQTFLFHVQVRRIGSVLIATWRRFGRKRHYTRIVWGM